MTNEQKFKVIKLIDAPNLVNPIEPGKILTGYQIKTAFRTSDKATRFLEFFEEIENETTT